MAIPTFFHQNQLIADTCVTLSESEAMHASKARRLQVGADIQLINGKGDLASCSIASLSKRDVTVNVTQVTHTPKQDVTVTIATAIPKGDRQKMMLDMLTQLGVDHIVPLECEFSATRFSDNMQQKWQRVCIESSKQSQRLWLPSIADAMTPEQCLTHYSTDNTALAVASADSDSSVEQYLKSAEHRLIMVGPEGGFSDAEQLIFKANQSKTISLANHILRTETASVAAAARLFAI